MDNSNDIIELLDILYGMVNEAWGVPLGNDKCIIDIYLKSVIDSLLAVPYGDGSICCDL